jgi:hypothetical protein
MPSLGAIPIISAAITGGSAAIVDKLKVVYHLCL